MRCLVYIYLNMYLYRAHDIPYRVVHYMCLHHATDGHMRPNMHDNGYQTLQNAQKHHQAI